MRRRDGCGRYHSTLCRTETPQALKRPTGIRRAQLPGVDPFSLPQVPEARREQEVKAQDGREEEDAQPGVQRGTDPPPTPTPLRPVLFLWLLVCAGFMVNMRVVHVSSGHIRTSI